MDNKPHQKLDFLLFTIFLIIYSLINLANFDLKMATFHVDDDPIFYAQAFKNPTLFEGDFILNLPVSLAVTFRLITSLVFLIPALLWRYLNIDPYYSTWILTLLQSIFFGLAIYIFTLAVTQRRQAAFLATLLTLMAAPWDWNLANYAGGVSGVFSPLPATPAFLFIVLSFTYLLRNSTTVALIFLLISGLIHPQLGLFACSTTGIYWLWQAWRDKKINRLFFQIISLAIVCIIIILPSTLFQFFFITSDPLPHNEVMAGMYANAHFYPWGGTASLRWENSWITLLKFCVLALISWRWRDKFATDYQYLWLSLVFITIFFSLTHLCGILFEIPTLIRLVGLRTPQLLTLLSMPLLAHYWLRHIQSGNWLGSTFSIFCLAVLLTATSGYSLIVLLILGLLFVDLSQGHFSIWRIEWAQARGLFFQAIAALVLIIWLIGFLLLPFTSNTLVASIFSDLIWGVRGSPPNLSIKIILIVSVLFLTTFNWLMRKKSWSIDVLTIKSAQGQIFGWVTITLIALSFLSLSSVQSLARSPQDAARLEAQYWIRDHMPPSAVFVNPERSWRTLSLRRRLYPFEANAFAYIPHPLIQTHRSKVLGLYNISIEEAQNERGSTLIKKEQALFREFETDDLLRFGTEFGATHLVLPKSYKLTPELLKIYQNEWYTIYSLETYPYQNTATQFYLTTNQQAPEQVNEAVKDAVTWYKQQPDAAAKIWLALAQSYYVQQDYERALPIFDHLILLDPNNIEAQAGTGFSAYLAQRYDQAIEPLNQFVELANGTNDDRVAQASVALEEIKCQMGDTETCITAYQKAIDILNEAAKLNDTTASEQIAELYIKLGRQYCLNDQENSCQGAFHEALNINQASWSLLTSSEQEALSTTLIENINNEMVLDYSELVASGEQQGSANELPSVADGPRQNTFAFIIGSDTTDPLTAPPVSIDLRQGSLAIWAQITDDGNPQSSLIRINPKNSLHIFRLDQNGKIRIKYNDILLGTTDVTITNNQWHHYIFTWQDGEQKLYIDGQLALSANTETSSDAIEFFAIGWPGDSTNYWWNGSVAELQTFSQPLTPGESLLLYQAMTQ